MRVRGARPSPRRYWLLAGRMEAPLAAGARPLGAQVPAPHPSAAAPVLVGGGLRARLPPSRGCRAATPPDEEGGGSPFLGPGIPLPRSLPTAGATLFGEGVGAGAGGCQFPGVKTSAPELGVSAQVSVSVVTSPPSLRLDKSTRSKACTALSPGLPPRVSRLSSMLPTWASAVTLEYLFLALLDALSPGSTLCPACSGCGLPLDVTPASGSTWWDC